MNPGLHERGRSHKPTFSLLPYPPGSLAGNLSPVPPLPLPAAACEARQPHFIGSFRRGTMGKKPPTLPMKEPMR